MGSEREQRKRRVSEAASLARSRTGVAGDAPFECVLSAVEVGIGIPVIIASLGPRLAGIYAPIKSGGVIAVAGKDSATRRRFTLAHELGHHCLGHGSHADTEESLMDEKDPREVDANQFAAEFLIPPGALDAFVEQVPEQESLLDLVCRVANFFSVSPQMARIRLTTCGWVTDPAAVADLDFRIARGEAAASFARLELRDRDDVCATSWGDLPRIPDQARDSQLYSLRAGRLDAQDFAREHGISAASVREILRGPAA